MKRSRKCVSAVAVMVILLAAGASAQPPGISSGTQIVPLNGEAGESRSLRNDNGISMLFKVKGLIPGNAYTVWWVVFDPELILVNATGHVANGPKGTFAAHLSAGDVSKHPHQVPLGESFDNPRTAYVQLVLKDHGPVVPGLVSEQISTVGGACAMYPGIGFCPDPIVMEHAVAP